MVSKIALLLLLILSFSCKTEDDTTGVDDFLTLSLTSINFDTEKDASLVVVNSNTDWTVTCPADWITFSTCDGDTSTGFIIGASENIKFPRQTTITISGKNKSKEIKVSQAGISQIDFKIKGVSFRLLLVDADTTFLLGLYRNQSYLDSYYISETEITNAQWKAITGSLPYDAENSSPNLPVIVNWENINEQFLPKINELTDYTFRLPTECEWEVAASGGKKETSTDYAGSTYLDDVAWYWENAGGKKHNVAQKQANELGLYDMSGNVSEWCSDWYEDWSWEKSVANNPTGPETGTTKVIRGGDYRADGSMDANNSCSITSRNSIPPDISSEKFNFNGYLHYPGFRLVIGKN